MSGSVDEKAVMSIYCFVSRTEYDTYKYRHWREIEKNKVFQILQHNGQSDMLAMMEAASVMTTERVMEFGLLCHATADGLLEVKHTKGSRFYSAGDIVQCFQRIAESDVDKVYVWADVCDAYTLLVEIEKEIDLKVWRKDFVLTIRGFETVNGKLNGVAHMDALRFEETGSFTRFVRRYNRVAPEEEKIIGETMVKLERNKCFRKYYVF